jgi:hypothetical protein
MASGALRRVFYQLLRSFRVFARIVPPAFVFGLIGWCYYAYVRKSSRLRCSSSHGIELQFITCGSLYIAFLRIPSSIRLRIFFH